MELGMVGRLLAHDVRAVARIISQLENGDPEGIQALRALGAYGGNAHLIGITGPPGSGKSTLTDKMIGVLRSRGKKVGVLAVDPSSPFSGGAILGDRLRMQSHSTDEGVFIRSMASRGTLGGVSRATAAACRVLDAAGYDFIIIETVGVGQSEVDIVRIADTVVLVSVPGLGDDIQVIKAGIMEIGDIFVVNKSDRDGSDRVVREIRSMLETAAMLKKGKTVRSGPDTLSTHGLPSGHHGASGLPVSPEIADYDIPPVLKTVAETGEGVEVLVDACLNHRAGLEARGEMALRRRESVRAEIRSILNRRLLEALSGTGERLMEDGLVQAVADRKLDVYGAADKLFGALFAGGHS